MTLLVTVICSFPLLPHELKNRGTKRRILKVLKIAHEKITWSGKEIPHVGRYGGHKWQNIWLRDLDAREVFPLSTKFLGLAGYQANT